jgi:KUP system potassium uptake protein
MGHFGALPIQLACLFVVLPCVILNYLGQAAWLMMYPQHYWNPFFFSTPKPIYWFAFVVATLATIAASQSLITASFSLISQAIHLNYFP